MSVKLYNGYRLSNTNILKINDFCSYIKEQIKEIARKKYYQQIAIRFTEALDTISYLKYLNEEEKLNNFIDLLIKGSKNISSVRDNYILNNTIPDNDIQDKILSVVINNKYHNDIIQADLTHENDNDLDYSYSICLMPYNNNEVLFTAYGKELNNLLSNIINSNNDEDISIVNKYGLSYFGYWDNVDADKSCTREEWLQRKEMWNKVFEKGNGIPLYAGLAIDLFDFRSELNLRLILSNWDEFQKYLIKKDIRTEEKAKDILKDKYTDEKYKSIGIDVNNMDIKDFKYSRHKKWEDEFWELLKYDTDIIKRCDDLQNDLDKVFIEITKDTIKSKLDILLK